MELTAKHLRFIYTIRGALKAKTTTRQTILSRDSTLVIFTCFEFERFSHFPTQSGTPKVRDHEGYCSQMPRSLPAATPQKIRGKTKGNRSIRCIPGGNEAIWDEELHNALIEGICF